MLKPLILIVRLKIQVPFCHSTLCLPFPKSSTFIHQTLKIQVPFYHSMLCLPSSIEIQHLHSSDSQDSSSVLIADPLLLHCSCFWASRLQGVPELSTERARVLGQSGSKSRIWDQVDTGCAESKSGGCSQAEASEKRQQLNIDGAIEATAATCSAQYSHHHSQWASVSSSDDAESRRALSIVILHADSDAAAVPFRTFPWGAGYIVHRHAFCNWSQTIPIRGSSRWSFATTVQKSPKSAILIDPSSIAHSFFILFGIFNDVAYKFLHRSGGFFSVGIFTHTILGLACSSCIIFPPRWKSLWTLPLVIARGSRNTV